MKKYINTSNYYLSTIASKIEASGKTGTFDISDTSIDGVTLPLEGYYWVDVDFGDVSKREIFRIKSRNGYTLTYDDRISPYGMKVHAIGASVGLRDFSQLLNSLSTNTDNFGEIEKTGDLSIKVRGGKVMSTGNAIMLYDVDDFTTSIPINSEKYVVLTYELSNDGILLAAFSIVDEGLLETTGQYPIAKITTNATLITDIIDLRPNIIYGGGEGDMKASMYDPNSVQGDAFNMDNMIQGSTNLFTSFDEKAYWNAKQEALVSGENIKTFNNQTLLGSGNIVSEFKLQAGTFMESVPQGIQTYTLVHTPMNNNSITSDYSFIVFNESGQVQYEGVDYSYDSSTKTITFYNYGGTEEYKVFVISALGEPIGGEYNQFLTQAEYDALGSSKESNNVVYHIFEVEED